MYFSYLIIIIPLEKWRTLRLNKFKSPYPMKLCKKFDQIFVFSLFSDRGKGQCPLCDQFWIPFHQECFVPNLVHNDDLKILSMYFRFFITNSIVKVVNIISTCNPNLFVCKVVVFRATREFFYLCSALMGIEQWGLICVPHPLWHRTLVYNGGPHIAKCLAMDLSLPVLIT